MSHTRTLSSVICGVALTAIAVVQTQQPTAPQQEPPQPPKTVIETALVGVGGPPHLAVPDFVALSSDSETVAAGRTIGEVLWHDLQFEREFDMIPRDTYRSIPAAKSLSAIPFDGWRELGADGVVIGTVQKSGDNVRVEVRLFQVSTQQSIWGKEYSGSIANPRLYAHTISDEIHQAQRALRGVARTKLVFSSDRDGERVGGTVEKRNVKEVYIADYDGENQRRVTVNRSLNVFPTWSADGRAIVYTSYRRNYPDLFISHIYVGKMEEPTKGNGHNWLASWSPDGSRIAFTSNREGNPEIYVMDRDGGNVRRLTNHPGIDSTPTWNPTGHQIAFTSDRGGSPQIYVVGVDGVGLRKVTTESYADRPTWSPAPHNEIAYASRSGPGFDIRILNIGEGTVRSMTNGEGSNESPSWAPNGRHLAFTSTRNGRSHIFTIARDGTDLRQITKSGNNYTPDWSR
jgi:TolB protein